MTISAAKTAAAISVILIHFFRVRSVCGQCGIREILRSRLVSYRFFRSAVYFRYSGFRGSSAKPFIFRSGVRTSGRPRTGPNVVGPLSDRCRNAARILSERCQNVAGSLSYASGRLRNLRLNPAVGFAIAFGNSRRNSGCGFCGPHSGICNRNSGRAVSVNGFCRVRFRPCGSAPRPLPAIPQRVISSNRCPKSSPGAGM